MEWLVIPVFWAEDHLLLQPGVCVLEMNLEVLGSVRRPSKYRHFRLTGGQGSGRSLGSKQGLGGVSRIRGEKEGKEAGCPQKSSGLEKLEVNQGCMAE